MKKSPTTQARDLSGRAGYPGAVPLLDLVTTPLTRILDAGELAERVVKETLRAHPELDNEQRRFVADLLFGVCVQRARLAHHLQHAGVALTADAFAALYLRLFHPDVPTTSAVALPAGIVDVPLPDDPHERLQVSRSVPRWLADDLIARFGLEAADRFLASCNLPGPVVARTNLLKTSREVLLERLRDDGIPAHAGALAPDAIVFEARLNVRGNPAWRDGWFEIQDEGSQLIAHATAARPGETVVDLCAGRGGKTLALGAMMAGRGTLHAFDVDRARLKDLDTRALRAGLSCVRASALDAAGHAPATLHGRADIVLVDVPCSELGTLRRSPDLRWRRQASELASFPPVQAAILDEGARLVRPGGRLVYATCTVLPPENEDGVQAFLARTPSFSLDDERHLLPHEHGTDGFYIARLSRR